MIQNRLKALPGYSLYQRVADKARNASVSSHAGAAAFFMMLSFLPFTMFLLSLLRFTPITESNLANIIQMIFPLSFGETISSLIGQIYNPNTNTLLPLSAITAVWLGSKSFLVLIRGINDVYEIKESRPFLLVRLLAFFYTFLFAILFVAVLTILVFGNTLYYHLCHIFPLSAIKISHDHQHSPHCWICRGVFIFCDPVLLCSQSQNVSSKADTRRSFYNRRMDHFFLYLLLLCRSFFQLQLFLWHNDHDRTVDGMALRMYVFTVFRRHFESLG